MEKIKISLVAKVMLAFSADHHEHASTIQAT